MTKFKIDLLEDDVFLNPSLREKFKLNFKIEFPEFPDEFDLSSLELYFEEITPKLEPKLQMIIQRRSFIGLFSYGEGAFYGYSCL